MQYPWSQLKILILLLALLLPASAMAVRSPQGYWTISPNCFAYSDVRWDDRSTGQSIITIVAKQNKFYIVVAATNPKWRIPFHQVNIESVKFSPSNVTFRTEVRDMPAGSGADPMVAVMVEATNTYMQLLRSSSKITVLDGTDTLTLPLIRVSDAFDGINACIN